MTTSWPILFAAGVLSASVLSACGTQTQFVATNPSPRRLVPRDPSTVEVWTTGVPNVPYTEVGILTARQESELSVDDMPEIIREMRARAAAIGCDAVAINGSSDKVVGNTSSDGHGHVSGSTSTLEGYWGACLVYLSEPPPHP
ncbi:MAG: hypothetical protein U1F43_22595 [Myxococcota bacterium]